MVAQPAHLPDEEGFSWLAMPICRGPQVCSYSHCWTRGLSCQCWRATHDIISLLNCKWSFYAHEEIGNIRDANGGTLLYKLDTVIKFRRWWCLQGFGLEDATGLSLNGDLDVQSVLKRIFPLHILALHRRNTSRCHQSGKPLPYQTIQSRFSYASCQREPFCWANGCAEDMDVRCPHVLEHCGRFLLLWYILYTHSNVLLINFSCAVLWTWADFSFSMQHGRNEVDMEFKKEEEFFGDIVIVSFMDSYDLVVLKTVVICKYGLCAIGSTYVRNLLLDAIVLNIDCFPPLWTLSLSQVHVVSARYIMKFDDDNFVRVQLVIPEVKKIPCSKSPYIGNMNYHHTPMRDGKWAVT